MDGQSNHQAVNLRSNVLGPPLFQRLHRARHIAVFTGAGISAESGIPTFRERFTGLWAKTDPQEVATPEAFRADPQRVWDWHVHLAATVRRAAPNAGHRAIARLQDAVERITVITQNIDDLHHAAGSRDVLELHGNLFRLAPFVDEEALFAEGRNPLICHLCGGYALRDDCDPYAGREDLEGLRLEAGPVPRCPACGALLRPDIVWFGEPLDPHVLGAAFEAADACDALICVGSSLEVEPAASIPYRAIRRGAVVIEINPEPTALSQQADAAIRGSAAEVLPALFQEVWG
ncbi:MAG: NAD-dependent protein deacylase [Rhodocyclaceae bacterium]|nr:MAG: NAD-dependent deacylase [Rhodocyclaceae bacterium]MBV6408683.1 NAD-dependent protein deacylase [Rhodocyclaceae bacterium]